MPFGDLVLEHVAQIVQAERALVFRGSRWRLGVAHQMREFLILHLNSTGGIFGGGFVNGCDPDDFVAGPWDGRAGLLHNFDRLYTRHLLRRTGVDADDFAVRVRRAHHFAVEHTGPLDVVGIAGLAGDFLGRIHSRGSFADKGPVCRIRPLIVGHG